MRARTPRRRFQAQAKKSEEIGRNRKKSEEIPSERHRRIGIAVIGDGSTNPVEGLALPAAATLLSTLLSVLSVRLVLSGRAMVMVGVDSGLELVEPPSPPKREEKVGGKRGRIGGPR